MEKIKNWAVSLQDVLLQMGKQMQVSQAGQESCERLEMVPRDQLRTVAPIRAQVSFVFQEAQEEPIAPERR